MLDGNRIRGPMLSEDADVEAKAGQVVRYTKSEPVQVMSVDASALPA